MIYVELKVFPSDLYFDMSINEESTVENMLEELIYYTGIDMKFAILFSVRKERRLRRELTLLSQGVRGGDTLILVV